MKKIIGVTVGTPISPKLIKEKLKPVTSVNGIEADENGNVEVEIPEGGGHGGITETDPTVPAWAKAEEKPTYKAYEVGADPEGTAANAVNQHNVDEGSHFDIRLGMKVINERLTAFFDSDDQTLDELSEIVEYIKSNKTLIDSITTSKVSVADIINNLVTNVSNKPLSAAQGVALKALIDGLSSGKLDASKLTEAINTALAQAKASGEFDGEKGDPGVGVSSVKQTTTSDADGGSNVVTVTLSNGATSTFTVKNGSKGNKGDPGKTPVKFTDYFTPADQEAIVQQVITALGTPVFGTVDLNKVVTLTGTLADGTYTFQYEDKNGNTHPLGSYTEAPPVTYTNLFEPSTATLNTRMSGSSQSPKTENGYVMTAVMPIPITAVNGSDDSGNFVAVPATMWTKSANAFLYYGSEHTLAGYIDAGTTKGTVVGNWVKIPLINQYNNVFNCSGITLSLYVKGSAITASDIQNIEIYFNEIPE